jgi:hypothetical protein
MKLSEYASVLRPGAPITDTQFLFGRQTSLLQLDRHLHTPGVHPLVTGHRGIGKTSLVRCYLSIHKRKNVWVNCSYKITFEAFARQLLSKIGEEISEREQTVTGRAASEAGTNLGLITAKIQGGRDQQIKKKFEKPDVIYPDTVSDILSKVVSKDGLLVILDEFDTVQSVEFQESFAELLRILSNHYDACPVKFLTIGIQSRATNLLATHHSLERCAREIYLEPIEETDLHNFIRKVEHELQFEVSEFVRNVLVSASGGFPYFVHLILQKCVEILLDEDRKVRLVEYNDYQEALKNSSKEAYRACRAKMDGILNDPKTVEYKILALMTAQKSYRIKTITIREEVTRHLDNDREQSELMIRDGIKNLIDRGVVYLDKKERSIGFIGPIVKLFVAETIKATGRSVDRLVASQQSLL